MTFIERACDICGRDVTQDQIRYVALNRTIFGDGRSLAHCEVLVDEEYLWDPQDYNTGARLLCYPGCLVTYSELKFAQLDPNFNLI